MARQVAEMKRSIGNPPGANIIANARQRAEVADLSKYMHENRPMPTPGFKPRPQNLEHRWTHNNNNGGHNSIIGHNDPAMNRLSGMKGAGALYTSPDAIRLPRLTCLRGIERAVSLIHVVVSRERRGDAMTM